MDSLPAATAKPIVTPFRIPDWALPRAGALVEADAAFAAGIALKTLDDLVRTEPGWAGCWRARQGLKCAAATARLTGRTEDEAALRDAVLLTGAGDDAGPAGRMFLAYRELANRRPVISSRGVAGLADLFGLAWDEGEVSIPEMVDAAVQSRRAPPLAVAAFVGELLGRRPDAEALAWALGDVMIAAMLRWERTVPLLMNARYGPSFKARDGRPRMRPGEQAFAGALCLALVEAAQGALQTAGEIARRTETLLAVAPKIRTKGASGVIRKLLEEDAMPATAPGSNLSRWAATRLFERLETLGGVRELSGRSSFRIYGV